LALCYVLLFVACVNVCERVREMEKERGGGRVCVSVEKTSSLKLIFLIIRFTRQRHGRLGSGDHVDSSTSQIRFRIANDWTRGLDFDLF
jgi:hypothetical protein